MVIRTRRLPSPSLTLLQLTCYMLRLLSASGSRMTWQLPPLTSWANLTQAGSRSSMLLLGVVNVASVSTMLFRILPLQLTVLWANLAILPCADR